MKRILATILILCLCTASFSACSNSPSPSPSQTQPAGSDSTTAPSENLPLLPQSMTIPVDGQSQEVQLNWTENSCSFTAVETAFTFTYDEDTGALSATITNERENVTLDDFCVFDDQGRILSISFGGQTFLAFSYEDKNATVTTCAGAEDFSPLELTVDWENRKTQMPPFNNPDDLLSFTEYGDLTGGEGTTLCTYEYDSIGNITKVTASETSIDLHYGDVPMTATWQRCPLKILLVYCFGWPFSVVAMDYMCMSLTLHHTISE